VTITFVGAGPGAPDLITLRGAQRLSEADVVIWAASLVPEALLQHCRTDVELHDSKSMTLEQVCAVYQDHPTSAVVRLHSGDTSIYSAVAEQIDWCRRNDRDFEIIPGVSSMSAAAAAAGCELTVPGVAQTVVMTRLAKRTSASMPPDESLTAAAGAGGTLALFLSITQVRSLVAELLEGPAQLRPDTPVVAAYRVSWPDEQILHTTLADLPDAVEAEGFDATTILLVGPALAAATPARRSHVYAGSYTTRFRSGTAADTDG
jgi:precorrin-4/cobalt-precorrin-4 C11-methyltransferase